VCFAGNMKAKPRTPCRPSLVEVFLIQIQRTRTIQRRTYVQQLNMVTSLLVTTSALQCSSVCSMHAASPRLVGVQMILELRIHILVG
jgi:hypothetical protein